MTVESLLLSRHTFIAASPLDWVSGAAAYHVSGSLAEQPQ